MVDQTANFVRGEADSSIAAGDTTISVVNASEFPDPANGQYNLVLWDDSLGRPDQDSDAEIVRVTGRDTTNDNLTVTRAQEGTSDVSHPSGSALQLSPTAKTIDDLAIGRFDTIEVFTSDGTFDASGIDDAFVEVVGGGGGGGGLVDNGTDTVQIGAGGGGGGYAASYVDVSNDSSITVTVGSAGTGSSGSSGSAGSDSSFGTSVTGGGGGGGTAADNNGTNVDGGNGGGGSGDIVIGGQDGGYGVADDGSYSDTVVAQSTSGGGSQLGEGASSQIEAGNVQSGSTVNPPTGYGGAGAGAINLSGVGSSSLAGGDGADGVVIVRY